MLSYRQEYWCCGSAGLAATWIVISQVVGRPGGLRSSSIGCLRYSVIPSVPWGRVITAQTGDNYQSEASSQVRRWEGLKPQDREHHRCSGRMSVCNRDQLDRHSGHNKESNKASGEPAANGNTVDGGSTTKKDRIHHASSQHVEQSLIQNNLL